MKKLISTNPSKNYEKIGEVPVSTEKEIREKVTAAQKAKRGWKEIGLKKRIAILERLYKAFDKRRADMAHLATREMGAPIADVNTIDLGDGFSYFRWYLDNAEKYLSPEITFKDKQSIHTVFYEPIGVAAVIVPWNWPFCNWVWGVVPNLLVGNPVIFKHSEEVPLFAKMLEEIINTANLPKGVFSQVYGDGVVGDYLVHQNIDLISFTGSTKVGKYLYEVAGKKFIRALMELGGSAPGIVFDDVDINEVIETIYIQRFTNCGQICDGLKRLIVHKNIAKELVQKLSDKLQTLHIGDAEDEKTTIGPLVAKRQLGLLESQVQDAIKRGAKVIIGGKKPKGLQGAYFEPTILTNITRSMRVWQEEVFGPVLPIITFITEEEAIQLANDTKYGLGAYVYTRNKKRATRVVHQLESNMVSVNGTNYVIPCNPFVGCKNSGLGREHGKYGLHDLTQVKVVATTK